MAKWTPPFLTLSTVKGRVHLDGELVGRLLGWSATSGGGSRAHARERSAHSRALGVSVVGLGWLPFRPCESVARIQGGFEVPWRGTYWVPPLFLMQMADSAGTRATRVFFPQVLTDETQGVRNVTA